MDLRFFGYNLTIFRPIDYYLSIGYEKYWFWALFVIIDFWALLGPTKGCCPTDTHMGLGPQNPTKKLTHLVDLLCFQAGL